MSPNVELMNTRTVFHFPSPAPVPHHSALADTHSSAIIPARSRASCSRSACRRFSDRFARAARCRVFRWSARASGGRLRDDDRADGVLPPDWPPRGSAVRLRAIGGGPPPPPSAGAASLGGLRAGTETPRRGLPPSASLSGERSSRGEVDEARSELSWRRPRLPPAGRGGEVDDLERETAPGSACEPPDEASDARPRGVEAAPTREAVPPGPPSRDPDPSAAVDVDAPLTVPRLPARPGWPPGEASAPERSTVPPLPSNVAPERMRPSGWPSGPACTSGESAEPEDAGRGLAVST